MEHFHSSPASPGEASVPISPRESAPLSRLQPRNIHGHPLDSLSPVRHQCIGIPCSSFLALPALHRGVILSRIDDLVDRSGPDAGNGGRTLYQHSRLYHQRIHLSVSRNALAIRGVRERFALHPFSQRIRRRGTHGVAIVRCIRRGPGAPPSHCGGHSRERRLDPEKIGSLQKAEHAAMEEA